MNDVDSLPLILSGPLLQRTEASQVTVWLALKAARSISLEVFTTQAGQGDEIGEIIATGQGNTIDLGKNLHLAVITAKPIEGQLLEPGQIYAYNLWFDGGREDLLTAIQTPDTSSDNLLSYFPHQLPTFVIPAQDLAHLRLVHGSCRKPHGGGVDGLSYLDDIIAESARLGKDRPQQLFMTGDQIYGDDVADPFLWSIQQICDRVIWDENLPLQQGAIPASQIPPGKRSEIARIEGGFTAMLDGNEKKAKSHLFSFAEYACAYLLAWSPVLIPSSFPQGKNLINDSKLAKQWDREVGELHSFAGNLNKVRRALANIASYTICDDHDISDDWCLNREWCDRVFGKPFGKRVVQNGLLAYALFQAWGNTPDLFTRGNDGEKLLQATVRWCQSQGTDVAAEDDIADYLGIPQLDPDTKLPKLQADGAVAILQRDTSALPWHYSWHNSLYEVIVLDTRTCRGYPQNQSSTAPPELLSPSALQQQLAIPLAAQKDKPKLTILVLPTNLVTLRAIDLAQQSKLKRDRVFSSDVGDSWNFNHTALARLLSTLCNQRDRVIILSGDIHYSCAVRFNFWFNTTRNSSVLVQLTSSAFKNSEWMTRAVHTKLKSLFLEPPEHWLGWQQPLHLEKLSPKNRSRSPDWQYRLQWIKRRPAKLYYWQTTSIDPRQGSFWRKMILGLSWLWRNRWLQEGAEVVGRNNLSIVSFECSLEKEPLTVIQETYWQPPWNDRAIAKSTYRVSLQPQPIPPNF
jgi:hypothetical protein